MQGNDVGRLYGQTEITITPKDFEQEDTDKGHLSATHDLDNDNSDDHDEPTSTSNDQNNDSND